MSPKAILFPHCFPLDYSLIPISSAVIPPFTYTPGDIFSCQLTKGPWKETGDLGVGGKTHVVTGKHANSTQTAVVSIKPWLQELRQKLYLLCQCFVPHVIHFTWTGPQSGYLCIVTNSMLDVLSCISTFSGFLWSAVLSDRI